MEEWKEFKWREVTYYISSLGRIKNTRGLILKQRINSRGYYDIRVWASGELKKNFSVHRLVAIAFISNPDDKKEVNHKNGIRTDNHADNLEWVTPSENVKHAFRMGLRSVTGTQNPCAKLSNSQVLEIRAKLLKGFTIASVAREYGRGETTIRHIRDGQTWSHV